MARLSCAVALVLLASAARGDPGELDRDIARRHFQAGEAAYEAGRLSEAVAEFEAARRVVPRPELDFNIGRAEDRLDHPAAAIAAYRRYLEALPQAADAAEVSSRVRQLEERVGGRRPRWAAPLAVGAVAVTLGAVGAGLLGSAIARYDALDATCGSAGTCAPGDWSALPPRDVAGKVLLGAAGVALVADVVLWVMTARRGRR
jgi:tetratricopeptide (TPR) repeat protein